MRKAHTPWVLLLIPLIALPARGQDPQSNTEVEETLQLTFAWPVGLTGEVESTTRRHQTGNPDAEMASRYRLEVLAGETDGVRVRRSGGEIVDFLQGGQLLPVEDDPTLQGLEGLTAIPSEFRIAPDGAFEGLSEAERWRAHVQDFVESVLGELEADARADGAPTGELERALASVREMIGQILTVEALQQGFEEEWTNLVWMWAGEEWEVGAWYVTDTEAPSPMSPDIMVPMEVEVGISGRVRCHDEAEPESCVLLEYRSVPGEEATSLVERTLRELMSQMGQTAEFELHALRQETHVRVVAEPGSLIPHSFRSTQTSQIEMTVDGEVQSGGQTREVETRYRWNR